MFATEPAATVMTLRDRLKRDTADAHARLDRGSVPRRLLGESLTLDGYARILQSYAVAHATLERRLHFLAGPASPRSGAYALPEFVPRLPGLERDLAVLAAVGAGAVTEDPSWPGGSSATYAGPGEPPPYGMRVARDARVLGLRYVLDGATRGARGIARRLESTLPTLRELDAFAYWTVQRRAAHDWPVVVERLSIVVPDAYAAEAVHEASEAFAVFERAFGKVAS